MGILTGYFNCCQVQYCLVLFTWKMIQIQVRCLTRQCPFGNACVVWYRHKLYWEWIRPFSRELIWWFIFYIFIIQAFILPIRRIFVQHTCRKGSFHFTAQGNKVKCWQSDLEKLLQDMSARTRNWRIPQPVMLARKSLLHLKPIAVNGVTKEGIPDTLTK